MSTSSSPRTNEQTVELPPLSAAWPWLERWLVYLLPVVCFIIDFAMARELWGPITQTSPYAIWMFAGTGMLLYASAGRFGSRRWTRAVAIGSLVAFALGAFAVGLVLLPFTLISLLLLIGFFGLVPFATGFAFVERARALNRLDRPVGLSHAPALMLGLLLPFLGPAGMHALYSARLDAHLRQFGQSMESAMSIEEQLRAIRQLRSPLLCITGKCAKVLCWKLRGPDNEFRIEGVLRDASMALLGPEPNGRCLFLTD